MMKMMTVHLVEELGDARKSESGNSAFDRLVGRLQLVQQTDLMVIIIISDEGADDDIGDDGDDDVKSPISRLKLVQQTIASTNHDDVKSQLVRQTDLMVMVIIFWSDDIGGDDGNHGNDGNDDCLAGRL